MFYSWSIGMSCCYQNWLLGIEPSSDSYAPVWSQLLSAKNIFKSSIIVRDLQLREIIHQECWCTFSSIFFSGISAFRSTVKYRLMKTGKQRDITFPGFLNFLSNSSVTCFLYDKNQLRSDWPSSSFLCFTNSFTSMLASAYPLRPMCWFSAVIWRDILDFSS